MTIDEPSATRVYDQLTIANIAHVRQESLNCDRVITVCQEPVSDNVSAPYEFYNLSDGEGGDSSYESPSCGNQSSTGSQDNYGGECSYELFAAAAGSLVDALHRGEDVVIHCHRGKSRSASVAVAATAVRYSMFWHYARDAIERQRPQIDPNEQLVEYGKRFVIING